MPRPDVLVACALLERDLRYCIARRCGDDLWAGYWEFPGGKVEAGETFEGCLVRELAEELGIEARIGAPIVTSFHDRERRIAITAFRADWMRGMLSLAVHDSVAWATVDELPRYRLLPADALIVELLRADRSSRSPVNPRQENERCRD